MHNFCGQMLVLTIQQCMTQNLWQTSKQRSFNQKGGYCFRFCKSMTKEAREEARRRERKLCHRSKHWHQVSSEPGHSFMSPESWRIRDWWSPLNWVPSPSWLCWSPFQWKVNGRVGKPHVGRQFDDVPCCGGHDGCVGPIQEVW